MENDCILTKRQVIENDCILTKRQVIEDTLQRLHDATHQKRAQDDAKREVERDLTRSLVRLAQLDTDDQRKIVEHTSHVTKQNEIRRLCDRVRALEDAYQQEKKKVASIPDKKLRHERVQQEKQKRDEAIAPLRAQLQLLDPTINSLITVSNGGGGNNLKLPSIGNAERRPLRSVSYREVMARIRSLQQTRADALDPYVVNWKIAKLWEKINEHERCFENYEKACKLLTEKQRSKIPTNRLEHVLETERQRRRDAYFYLFNKALGDGARQKAADHIVAYLSLSLPSERISTVEFVERVLRQQEYVEDPTLTTPEDVTVSILCSRSFGPLTDLRFNLLEELLTARPQDPYVLEAIACFHVRKHDYTDAKSTCDRFVQLPEVKRLHLYATLSEYSPSMIQ